MTPQEALAFMKNNRILRLRTPEGLELELHPDAFTSTSPIEIEDEPANLDVKGKHGMTRREQQELFGHVFETDFVEG